MPQEQIQERTVEETIDVPVPYVMEKFIERYEAHSTEACA